MAEWQDDDKSNRKSNYTQLKKSIIVFQNEKKSLVVITSCYL